jgi:trimeric autotransporter adhesin
MKFHPLSLILPLCICVLMQAQTQSPLAQKRLNAELLASDGQANSTLGASVAVSGDVVAVATQKPNAPVYLFSRLSKGIVNQMATLSASDGALLYSVAVGDNGSLVVAGAINETVGKNADQGAVYVFEEPQEGWTGNITETAKLTASDGGANHFLGTSVSTTNGIIVAGAYLGGDQGQGEAYVYVKPQSGWANGTETAQLKASNGQTGDWFGNSVSIEGPRVVVGAPLEGATAGMAYVFQEPRGGWKGMTETAQLTHGGSAELGASVAVLGGKPSTVVVGAPETAPRGAAFVYIEPTGGWVSTNTPTATLTETQSTCKCLGFPVAIDAQMIALGDSCVTYGHNGSVTGDTDVFLTPTGGWKNSNAGVVIRPKGGNRSYIPAVGKNRVIIGAEFTNVGGNQKQGAAFIFTVPAQ